MSDKKPSSPFAQAVQKGRDDAAAYRKAQSAQTPGEKRAAGVAGSQEVRFFTAPDGSIRPITPASGGGKVVKSGNLFVDPQDNTPYKLDPLAPSGLRNAWNDAPVKSKDGKLVQSLPGMGTRELGDDPKAVEAAAQKEQKAQEKAAKDAAKAAKTTADEAARSEEAELKRQQKIGRAGVGAAKRTVAEVDEQFTSQTATARETARINRGDISYDKSEVSRLDKALENTRDPKEREALEARKAEIEATLPAKVKRQHELDLETSRAVLRQEEWRQQGKPAAMQAINAESDRVNLMTNTGRRGALAAPKPQPPAAGAAAAQAKPGDGFRAQPDGGGNLLLPKGFSVLPDQALPGVNLPKLAEGMKLLPNGAKALDGLAEFDAINANMNARAGMVRMGDIQPGSQMGVFPIPHPQRRPERAQGWEEKPWATEAAVIAQKTAREVGKLDFHLPDGFAKTPAAAKEWMDAGAGGQVKPEEVTFTSATTSRVADTSEAGFAEVKGQKTEVIATVHRDENGLPVLHMKPGAPSPSLKSGNPHDGVPEYADPESAVNARMQSLGLPEDMRPIVRQQVIDGRWPAEKVKGFIDSWQGQNDYERAETIKALQPRLTQAVDSWLDGTSSVMPRLDLKGLVADNQISAQEARMMERTFYGEAPVAANEDPIHDLNNFLKTSPTEAAGIYRDIAAKPDFVLNSKLARETEAYKSAVSTWRAEYLAANEHRMDFDRPAFQQRVAGIEGSHFNTGEWLVSKLEGGGTSVVSSFVGMLERGGRMAFSAEVAQGANLLPEGPAREAYMDVMFGKRTVPPARGAELLAKRAKGIPLTDPEATELYQHEFKGGRAGGPGLTAKEWDMSAEASIEWGRGVMKYIREKTTPASKLRDLDGRTLEENIDYLAKGIDAGTLTPDTLGKVSKSIQEQAFAWHEWGDPKDSLSQGIQAGAVVGLENGGLAGLYDATNDGSPLAQALAAYKQTGDPSYIENLKTMAKSSPAEMRILEAASKYASMNGVIAPTDAFGMFEMSRRGMQTAGVQEVGTEVLGDLLGAGVAKALILGVKGTNWAKRATVGVAKAEQSATLMSKLAAIGTKEGATARNFAVQGVKSLAFSAPQEYVEEAITEAGSPGGSFEGRVHHAGMEGAWGGWGGAVISSGLAAGQLAYQAGVVAAANKKDNAILSAFVQDWNTRTPNDPVTVEDVKQARAYVPPAVSQVWNDKVEGARVALQRATEQHAETGDVVSRISLNEAKHHLAVVEQERAINIQQSIEAAREVNGIADLTLRAFADAAIKVARGVALTPDEQASLERAVGGVPPGEVPQPMPAMDAKGKVIKDIPTPPMAGVPLARREADGRYVITDAGLETLRGAIPRTAGLMLPADERSQMAAMNAPRAEPAAGAPVTPAAAPVVPQGTSNGLQPQPPAAAPAGGVRTFTVPVTITGASGVVRVQPVDVESTSPEEARAKVAAMKAWTAYQNRGAAVEVGQATALPPAAGVPSPAPAAAGVPATETINQGAGQAPGGQTTSPATESEWQEQAAAAREQVKPLGALLRAVTAGFGYKIVDTGLPFGFTDRYGTFHSFGTQIIDKAIPGSDIGQWIDKVGNSPVADMIRENLHKPGLHRVWFGHDPLANIATVVEKFGVTALPEYAVQLLKDMTTKSGIPLPGVQWLVHKGIIGDAAATEWLSLNIGEALGAGLSILGTYKLYRKAKDGKDIHTGWALVGIAFKMVGGALSANPIVLFSGLADTAILVGAKAGWIKAGLQKANEQRKADATSSRGPDGSQSIQQPRSRGTVATTQPGATGAGVAEKGTAAAPGPGGGGGNRVSGAGGGGAVPQSAQSAGAKARAGDDRKAAESLSFLQVVPKQQAALALAAIPNEQKARSVDLLVRLDKVLDQFGRMFSGGVRFVKGAGTFKAKRLDDGTTALTVNLSGFLDDFQDTSSLAAVQSVVGEELIHLAAMNALADNEVTGLWRALPYNIRQTVWTGYRAAEIKDGTRPEVVPEKMSDEEAWAMAHEFHRILIQKGDPAFMGLVTEAIDASPSLGQKLIEFLKKFADILQGLVADLEDGDLKQTIQEQQERIKAVLKQIMGRKVDLTGGGKAVVSDGMTNNEWQMPNAVRGSEGVAYTEGNEQIGFRWAVVEVDSLTISNTDDGRINPKYPAELQPRDRTSAASEAQVNEIAGNSNLDRLSTSNSVGDGAPFVGPDGVVESGNGRMMALNRAYQNGLESIATYRAKLESRLAEFGLATDGLAKMKHPVLVRVRTTNVDRAAFAQAANVATVAPMREVEIAKKDAGNLSPAFFDSFQPSADGDIFTAANADFIRGFVREIVPQTERAAMVDKAGNLTQTGLRRIRNAVFAYAYGTNAEALNTLSRLTEDIDPANRSVTNALVAAAPIFAEQAARMEAGALHPLDITADLVNAVTIYNGLRERGETVADYLAQVQMPGMGEERGPLVDDMLQWIDENKRSGGRMFDTLRAYATAVEQAGDPRQGALFGDRVPTKAEIWEAAAALESETNVLAAGNKTATTAGMASASGAAQNANEPSPGGLSEAGVKSWSALERVVSNWPQSRLDPDTELDAWIEFKQDQMPDAIIAIERIYKPLFRDIQASWNWDVARTGSQYIYGEIPLSYTEDNEPLDTKEFKISVRDHEASPFREKELGYNTKVIEIDSFADPVQVKRAFQKVIKELDRLYRLSPKANAELLSESGAAGIKPKFEVGEAGTSPQTPPSVNPNLNPKGAEGRALSASLRRAGLLDVEDQRAQLDWLNQQARGGGYASVDELVMADSGRVMDLARQWRKDHPVMLEFPATMGSLDIPRGEMPQIKRAHRGALTNFLNARGITLKPETVPAASLKPSQADYAPAKVEQAANFDTSRRLLISSDNHVLDGHHQWLANYTGDVEVFRLGAPARAALEALHAFPSSRTTAELNTYQRRTRTDEEFDAAFANWEHGFDERGLPNPPKTLPDDSPLLKDTLNKTLAVLTEESPLVEAGLLPAGKPVLRSVFREAVLQYFLRKGQPLAPGQKPVVFASAGGGGAGKTTVLNALGSKGEIDRKGAVQVNADDIKELIPEYDAIAKTGDGRGAGVVHEESSILAKALVDRLLDPEQPRYNFVYDATLANTDKALAMMNRWKAAGYEVHLVGVTITPMQAMKRAALRALGSMRWVPNKELAAAHQGFNAGVKRLAESADKASIYDNTAATELEVAKKSSPDHAVYVVNPIYWGIIDKRKSDETADADTNENGPDESLQPGAGLAGGTEGSGGGNRQAAGPDGQRQSQPGGSGDPRQMGGETRLPEDFYLDGGNALQRAHDRFAGARGLLNLTAQSVAGTRAGDNRAGAGATGVDDPDADIAELRRFARESGLMLDGARTRALMDDPAHKLKGGAEHRVALLPGGRRVIKDLDSAAIATESLFDYFTDHQLANHFFGDDITIEGFYEHTDGRLHVVTSQPFIKGYHPSWETLVKKLSERGLAHESPGSHTPSFLLEDPTVGVLAVTDLHQNNVVVSDATGNLEIIDAHFYFDDRAGRQAVLSELGLDTAGVASLPEGATHIMPDGAVLTGPRMHELNAGGKRAYHGTPHKVDRFSTEKIGTGEGAQVYGWGLYFAENPSVAEWYRDNLSGMRQLGVPNTRLIGSPVNRQEKRLADHFAKVFRIHGPRIQDEAWQFSNLITIYNYNPVPKDDAFYAAHRAEIDAEIARTNEKVDAARAKLPPAEFNLVFGENPSFDHLKRPYSTAYNAAMRALREEYEKLGVAGNLYTVELLGDQDAFLDWDKPLSQQSEKVKAAIAKVKLQPYDKSVHSDPRAVDLYSWADPNPFGGSSDSKAAAQALLEAGIVGIRYLDAQSRKTTYYQHDSAWLAAAKSFKADGQDWQAALAGLKAAYPDARPNGLMQAVNHAYDIEEGTRNYVIFDEKLVRILEENGRPVDENEMAMLSAGQRRIKDTGTGDLFSFAAESPQMFVPAKVEASPISNNPATGDQAGGGVVSGGRNELSAGNKTAKTAGMASDTGAAQNANEPSPGGLSEAERLFKKHAESYDEEIDPLPVSDFDSDQRPITIEFEGRKWEISIRDRTFRAEDAEDSDNGYNAFLDDELTVYNDDSWGDVPDNIADIWEKAPKDWWDVPMVDANDRSTWDASQPHYAVQTNDGESGWMDEDRVTLNLKEAVEMYQAESSEDKRLVYVTGKKTRGKDRFGDWGNVPVIEIMSQPSFVEKLLRVFPGMDKEEAGRIASSRNKDNTDPWLVAQAYARHTYTNYDDRLQNAREMEEDTSRERGKARFELKDAIASVMERWTTPKNDEAAKVSQGGFQQQESSKAAAISGTWPEQVSPQTPPSVNPNLNPSGAEGRALSAAVRLPGQMPANSKTGNVTSTINGTAQFVKAQEEAVKAQAAQAEAERANKLGAKIKGAGVAGMKREVGEAWANVVSGNIDRLDYYAPGFRDIWLDSERKLGLARAAVNGVMEKLHARAKAGFGYPAWWKNPLVFARWKKFQAELLPVAARLEVEAINPDGSFAWKPFDMRAGEIDLRKVKAMGKKAGDVIMVNGEPLVIGRLFEEQAGSFTSAGVVVKKHLLLRPMSAAAQQQVYDSFLNEWSGFPVAGELLTEFIMPGMAGAREVGPRGVRTAAFNRYSLLDFFNEWPPELQQLFGPNPMKAIPQIEGYTPDLFTLRGLSFMIAGLTKAFKSGARQVKSGAARESGNVQNLMEGFQARLMEAHREKIVLERRARVLNAAAKPMNQVPDDQKHKWLPLNDAFNKLYELAVVARGLDRAKYPKITGALSPDQEVFMRQLVGEAWALRGRNLAVPEAIYKDMVGELAVRDAENLLLKAVEWLVDRFNAASLASTGFVAMNWLGNELMKTSFMAAQAFKAGALLTVGEGQRARLAFDTLAHMVKGMVVDRFPLRQQRIRDVVPRELFDNEQAIKALKGLSDTVLDNLKSVNVGGAILAAMKSGNWDVGAKVQLAHAAYRAHMAAAWREAGKPGKTAAAREAWMKNWLEKDAPDTLHREVQLAAGLFLMDYQNVPRWMDASSLKPVVSDPDHPARGVMLNQLLRLGIKTVIPFIRWQYSFAKAVKRQGWDAGFKALFTGKTKAERAEAAGSLAALGLMVFIPGLVAALGEGGDDDDDKITGELIGRVQDIEGGKLPQTLSAKNRFNVSALARILATRMGMSGHSFNITDDAGDEADLWMRYRNYPYVKEGVVLGLAATGQREAFGESWTSLFQEYASLGIAWKIAETMFGARDQYGTPESQIGGMAFDVATSPVLPHRMLRDATNLIDPTDRRLTPSKSLGYTPSFAEGIKSRLPGLKDNLPVAGNIKQPAKVSGRTTATPAEVAEVSKEFGIDPAAVTMDKAVKRDTFADLVKLRKLGATKADVKVSTNDKGQQVAAYPDPATVRKKSRFYELIRSTTAANLLPVKREAYKAAVLGKEKEE